MRERSWGCPKIFMQADYRKIFPVFTPDSWDKVSGSMSHQFPSNPKARRAFWFSPSVPDSTHPFSVSILVM
ncbi:MAG: hypothetical protein ACYCT9_13365 [Leptospirillum sp.]